MKMSVKLIRAVLVSFIISSCLYAQGGFEDIEYEDVKKVAQSGYQFLKIGVGARGTGMGGAAVTNEGDASALFWNPAGITSIEGYSASISYTDWLADMSHQSLAFVADLGVYGHIGVSALNMDNGEIQGTEISNEKIGYVDTELLEPTEIAVGITYGRRFTDKLGLGVTVKYCSQDLIDTSSSVVAWDIGTLYHTGWKNVKIGMSIQHFSKEIEYIDEHFELPLVFRVGISGDLLALSGIESSVHQLTFAFEGVNPRDFSERFHLGFEYLFSQLIAVRGGYKFNYDYESLSLGAAIKFKGAELGYAYSSFGAIFNSVSRFSINLNI